jgi:phosphoglycolate phosphatase-like HAD superfamily hydrolase
VVLDIGGTIIEDLGDVPTLLRRSLASHGVDSTPQEIAKWRGASKREIIRHFVSQHSLPSTAVYDQFNAELMAVYRSCGH